MAPAPMAAPARPAATPTVVAEGPAPRPDAARRAPTGSMPDPIDTQLDELRRKARRRLIGAIVLALAAAVLVPILLDSDPKPLGEDVSVKIPPVDDSKFVSKLADKGKAPALLPVRTVPCRSILKALWMQGLRVHPGYR